MIVFHCTVSNSPVYTCATYDGFTYHIKCRMDTDRILQVEKKIRKRKESDVTDTIRVSVSNTSSNPLCEFRLIRSREEATLIRASLHSGNWASGGRNFIFSLSVSLLPHIYENQ